MTYQVLNREIELFLEEDDIARNFFYIKNLPDAEVECTVRFKSDMLVAGLPYFFATFNYLLRGERDFSSLMVLEGSSIQHEDDFTFTLPFSVALTGERVALNLLQRASSIATETRRYVEKAKKYNIAILDTRKTTPGLRSFEKYAVRMGGGFNHRFGQTDVWMIKDNHKSFFGGIRPAVEFFQNMQSFYTPLVVEIHSLTELHEAINLKLRHVLLDNFTPQQVKESVKLKPDFMTYEVSGKIRLDILDSYLIDGVDAISVGALTYDAHNVDISLKYKRIL